MPVAPSARADVLLVCLLGQRDALWLPQRRFGHGHAATNVHLGRHAYEATGLPWASAARDAAGRKRSQRALDELTELGMVERMRSAGRTVGIRFTDAGEVRAQYLAGLPALVDSWPWAIYDAILDRDCDTPEDDLIPAWRAALQPVGDWSRTDCLDDIQHCLIPFLARRWLVSGSTVRGNVRYWPSPSAGDAEPPMVEPPTVTDAQVDIARALYVEELEHFYLALGTEEPTDAQQIGEIPLPVSAATQAQLDAWTASAALAQRGE